MIDNTVTKIDSAESHAHALLCLLAEAQHLKQLPRTGWLFANVVDPESVAAHTCLTAMIALFLGDIINLDWATQELSAPLDMERVLRLALIHDLGESILTDLPWRSSELLGSTVKHTAEEDAMRQLSAKLPTGAALLNTWREYDAKSSPEAQLVKDADRLDMVYQALAYERRGHTNLDEFWQENAWNFVASRELFELLCQQRAAQ